MRRGVRYSRTTITEVVWLLNEAALLYKIDENRVPRVVHEAPIDFSEMLPDLFVGCWLRVHLLGDTWLAGEAFGELTMKMVIAKKRSLEKVRILPETKIREKCA